MLGLLPSTGKVLNGSIQFDGVELVGADVQAMDKLRGTRIAYVPQEPMSNLDPSFTIGSQLVEPMRVALGMSKAQAKQKALALLARVGIPDPARTFRAYPHEISGGMAQRVLIAGAVSCDPDLIIADEPTTALDVTVQAEVLDLLRELRAGDAHGPADRLPQLRRRRRSVRSGGGDEGRPDRRVGPGAVDLQGRPPSLHPVAARRDPRGRPGTQARTPRRRRATETLEDGAR